MITHSRMAAIMLLAALIACAPPISAPTATALPIMPSSTPNPTDSLGVGTTKPAATVTPPPPGGDAYIEAWIDEISISSMMDTVFALSSLPTRQVNNPTIHEAAQIIYDMFVAAGGNLHVTTDEFPLVWNGIATAQQNIIATLPGTDPTAGVVLIGAHYDSRTTDLNDAISPAPGANDNASGVAIVLELARVLASETPSATIVFAAFSAEEVGREGSKNYVEAAQASGENIRAVIVFDIVGNSAGPVGEGSIRVFSADPPDSPSRQLAYTFQEQGERFLPGLDIQVQPAIDRPGRYSDHMSFSDAGFPAVRLIEPIEDLGRQHSAFDTPDAISGNYMQAVAQAVLAWMGSFAW